MRGRDTCRARRSNRRQTHIAEAQVLQSRDFQVVLRRLGRKHELTGKMRESLLSISRVLSFLTPAMEGKANRDVRTHIKTLTRDVPSLQDHTSFLGGKLNYLLDATLGLINIDQNNIIKIMSVAAIVFLPPTLCASIWGMNFQYMPDPRAIPSPWSLSSYPASCLMCGSGAAAGCRLAPCTIPPGASR